MGMGQLRGGVDSGVCHTTLCLRSFIDAPRAARAYARNTREYSNSRIAHFEIREYSHKSELQPVATAAWNVHHTCPTPHGVGGVLGGGRLPRGTSPRPHGALRTRFARIRRTFGVRFARYATRRRTHTAPTQPSKAYQSPHKNPPTHGSRWGKPPAPPAFTHVPRRVGRGPRIFACRGCVKSSQGCKSVSKPNETDFNCRELFMVHQVGRWVPPGNVVTVCMAVECRIAGNVLGV
jgi:hypothetical protein